VRVKERWEVIFFFCWQQLKQKLEGFHHDLRIICDCFFCFDDKFEKTLKLCVWIWSYNNFLAQIWRDKTEVGTQNDGKMDDKFLQIKLYYYWRDFMKTFVFSKHCYLSNNLYFFPDRESEWVISHFTRESEMSVGAVAFDFFLQNDWVSLNRSREYICFQSIIDNLYSFCDLVIHYYLLALLMDQNWGTQWKCPYVAVCSKTNRYIFSWGLLNNHTNYF
jgi:hypothetical protein